MFGLLEVDTLVFSTISSTHRQEAQRKHAHLTLCYQMFQHGGE